MEQPQDQYELTLTIHINDVLYRGGNGIELRESIRLGALDFMEMMRILAEAHKAMTQIRELNAKGKESQ